MAIFDHLGITVDDVARSTEQFHPVMEAFRFSKYDSVGSVSWYWEGETELILISRARAGHR